TPQSPLDNQFIVQQIIDPLNVVVTEITRLRTRIDLQLLADLDRSRLPHTVQVLQRNVGRLVVRDVDTLNTWHLRPLRLLLEICFSAGSGPEPVPHAQGFPLTMPHRRHSGGLTPDAACDAGSTSRSHRPDPAGERSCSSRRCV